MDITLSFQDGRSDKIYRTWMEPRSPAPSPTFEVLTAWGRRGGTMQTGSKGILSKDDAESVQRKLVAEKVAKGYRAAAQDATEVQVAAKSSDGKQIGGLVIAPMLLNEVSLAEVEALIEDPGWCTQVKWDGVRIELQRIGGEVLGFSRTNKPIALPKPIVDAMLSLDEPCDIVLDGEIIGDTAYLFDLLRWHRRDLASKDYYRFRLKTMEGLLENSQAALQTTITAYTSKEKRAMLATLRENGAEGIVFKRLDAPHQSGRPNSGGHALKHKFVTTASVIVAGPNGTKRSVEMKLFDGTAIGHVTIPLNKEIPQTGAVIECRYLYAHRGGSLTQPVYLGVREDVEPEECTMSQLQFKGEKR